MSTRTAAVEESASSLSVSHETLKARPSPDWSNLVISTFEKIASAVAMRAAAVTGKKDTCMAEQCYDRPFLGANLEALPGLAGSGETPRERVERGGCCISGAYCTYFSVSRIRLHY